MLGVIHNKIPQFSQKLAKKAQVITSVLLLSYQFLRLKFLHSMQIFSTPSPEIFANSKEKYMLYHTFLEIISLILDLAAVFYADKLTYTLYIIEHTLFINIIWHFAFWRFLLWIMVSEEESKHQTSNIRTCLKLVKQQTNQ